MILDDTSRGSKPNVAEKTFTLITDPLDEDRLLTLLHSVIEDSIRMCTSDEYIGTGNPLLLFFVCFFFWGGGLGGNTLRENELL